MTTELEKNLSISRLITESMEDTNAMAIQSQRIVNLANQFFKNLSEPTSDTASTTALADELTYSLNKMTGYITSLESVVATKATPKV